MSLLLATVLCGILLFIYFIWKSQQPAPGTAPSVSEPITAAPSQAQPPISATESPIEPRAEDKPALVAAPSGINDPVQSTDSEQGPYTLDSGSFVLPSEAYKNPEVTCHYIIPRTSSGSTPKSAHTVVCYFPFPKESTFFNDQVFNRLAKESGLTIFGVFFDHQAEGEMDYADTKHCYYYPESGSGETVLAAHKKVCDLAGIPAGKLIAFGNSGGACAAVFFANSYPTLFNAVIATGGGAFPSPIISKASCWLLLHSRGDAVETSNIVALKNLHEKNVNTIYLTTPPEWGRRGRPTDYFRHCINDDAREIVFSYISAVAKSLNGSGLPISQWRWDGVNGLLPKQLEDACRSIPLPRTTVEYEPGKHYILAKPRQDRQGMGIILFDYYNYPFGLFDMLYDIDYLCSQGYVVATADLSDESDTNQRLASIRLQATNVIPDIFIVGFDPSPDSLSVLRNASLPIKGRVFFETYTAGIPFLTPQLKSMTQQGDNFHLYMCDGKAPWGLLDVKGVEAEGDRPALTDRYCQERMEKMLNVFRHW